MKNVINEVRCYSLEGVHSNVWMKAWAGIWFPVRKYINRTQVGEWKI
jgi:hypothetical protein